jgi:hypothetical protein
VTSLLVCFSIADSFFPIGLITYAGSFYFDVIVDRLTSNILSVAGECFNVSMFLKKTFVCVLAKRNFLQKVS